MAPFIIHALQRYNSIDDPDQIKKTGHIIKKRVWVKARQESTRTLVDQYISV